MTDPLRCAELANGGAPCTAIPAVVVVEADGVSRCLSHATDPLRVRRREERNLRGGHGRRRTLTLEEAEKMIRLGGERQNRGTLRRIMVAVATGALDDRTGRVLIAGVTANTQERAVAAQERLAGALQRLEHGGAAVVMLERLTAGLVSGPRRPLPGRASTPALVPVGGA